MFEKGFTPRWTEEGFRISEIILTIPITYTIIELNGEEIKGSFYEQELQKTTLVGYSDAFNSWVDNKAIVGKL